MKRFCVVLSVLLMISGFVFASGSSEPAAPAEGEPTPLTFWAISAHADFYKERAAAWNELHPDRQIDLNVVSYPSTERQSKLLVAVQSGVGAPDFCDVNIIHFGTYLEMPEVPFLPLNDLVEPEIDVFVKSRLELYSRDGQYYGAPTHAGANVVYYNTNITDAAGIDIDAIKTWEDYFEAGRTVLEKTGKPWSAVETMDVYPFQPMLLQRGSDFFDEEGNVILDNETNIEILEMLLAYEKEGILVPMPGGNNTAEAFYQFMNGDGMAALVMPLWYISNFNNYMTDLSGHIKIRPLPMWEDSDIRSACTGGTGSVVLKTTKYPELAKEFLYFAKMSYDGQIEAYEMMGMDPYRTDVMTDPALSHPIEFFSNENVFEIVKDSIPGAASLNNNALVPRAFELVGSRVMYNVFLTHDDEPASALKSAADELRSLQ